MIYPGAVLEVPLPSTAIEEHNCQRFYVVEPGDTLRGIAARLLGDPDRYEDLFALNVGVAQLGERGSVLTDPDLIWPGLRLQLASGEANPPEPSAVQSDEGASATATPRPAPALVVAPLPNLRTSATRHRPSSHTVDFWCTSVSGWPNADSVFASLLPRFPRSFFRCDAMRVW